MIDITFNKAMDEYLNMVESACNSLLNDIEEKSKVEVRDLYDLLGYKKEYSLQYWRVGEKVYRFHGVGCALYENEKLKVDWDFGYRGRWCGIEPFKVAQALEAVDSEYRDLYSADKIRETCELCCATEEMFKKGHQYYYDLLKQDYIVPSFPEDYDSIVISYLGNGRRIPRTKLTDKFIKKSTKVYNRINELENNFVLEFYQGKKLIFKTHYNPIAFPENAVKIMTDQIIKPSFELNWWKVMDIGTVQ